MYGKSTFSFGIWNKNPQYLALTATLSINEFIGEPINEKSFLEIFGYNAPFSQSIKLPQNFILKKIGSDIIEERGEYNNLEFEAMIKMIPENKSENNSELIGNIEKNKSELIQSFKNNAMTWGGK